MTMIEMIPPAFFYTGRSLTKVINIAVFERDTPQFRS